MTGWRCSAPGAALAARTSRAPAPQHGRGPSRRRRCRAPQCSAGDDGGLASVFEKLKKRLAYEMNYENWAPRGARAYRLREIPRDVMMRDADKAEPGEECVADSEDDGVLSEAVRLRLAAIAEAERAQPGAALTGEELASLCLAKYGVVHDMAIKQVDILVPGVTRFVALNLYCSFLGQRSFPLSEDAFFAKLDAVAFMINAFDCAEFTRDFFRAKVAPRAGLPSRPRVDTAVSLRLNSSPTWKPELVEAVFASASFE